jgi:hypothetical protein
MVLKYGVIFKYRALVLCSILFYFWHFLLFRCLHGALTGELKLPNTWFNLIQSKQFPRKWVLI